MELDYYDVQVLHLNKERERWIETYQQLSSYGPG